MANAPATLEDELETARRAFDAGDSRHAIHHLGGAFALGPNDERVHALFEAIANRVDLARNLPDDSFYGTALVRAHALRRAGDLDGAVAILAQISELLPDRGFEVQLASWLVAAQTSGRVLSEPASMQVARLLTSVSRSSIGLHRLLPGERALLAGYGELAQALERCATAPFCKAMAIGMYRRLGRFEEALKVELPEEPVTRAHVMTQRALTLRAMGDGAGAAALFHELAEQAPGDRAFVVEEARSRFVAGEEGRALELLDSLEPDGDPEVAALAAFCREPPAGDRVDALDGVRRARWSPNLGLPADATANIFRERGATWAPGKTKVRVGVSGWESPSNRLLVALYAHANDEVAAASYELGAFELPMNPYSVRRGSAAPLWIPRDGIFVQGVPAPAPEVSSAIGRIAAECASFDAIWKRAEELGSRLLPEVAADVVASMVHPPSDPAWLQALPHVLYRHQVAAACVLAHLPDWDRTRPLFEGLIFGPVDWASAAAIAALTELARRDPARAPACRAMLCDAASDLVQHSSEPRFGPLLSALETLPAVPAGPMEKLQAWYREVHGPESEESAPPPEPPSAPGERAQTLTAPVATRDGLAARERPDSAVTWIACGGAALALIAALAWLLH